MREVRKDLHLQPFAAPNIIPNSEQNAITMSWPRFTTNFKTTYIALRKSFERADKIISIVTFAMDLS